MKAFGCRLRRLVSASLGLEAVRGMLDVGRVWRRLGVAVSAVAKSPFVFSGRGSEVGLQPAPGSC